MDRIEMLIKAVHLAREEIKAVTALSEAHYTELKKLPNTLAVEQLAQELLQEASDTIIE